MEVKPYGQSGKMLSEIVAPLGDVVDDIAFVHNVVGKTGVHSQGTLLQTTGFQLPGFPSAGAWVSYALGSESDNLPSFVVLPDHRGLASNGAKNWANSFLPAEHQGTVIRPGSSDPIANLHAPTSDFITSENDRAGLAALGQLNQQHASDRVGDDRLMARVRSYQLAAAMQLSASDALDVSSEPQSIEDLYGLSPDGPGVDDSAINVRAEQEFFGRKCLIARRLLERGVRFIQIWSGNDNGFPRRNRDSHEDVQRDHNPFVFTNWLCGGGIKGGTFGESDQWGYKPLDRSRPTTVYDIHATMLHLFGIDHTRLSVRHNSIDRRLTDVHGHVIKEMLL
jgi:hypothetical protein